MKINRIAYRRNRFGRSRHENVIIVERGKYRRLYRVSDSKAARLRKCLKDWPAEGRWAAFDSKPYHFSLTMFDGDQS